MITVFIYTAQNKEDTQIVLDYLAKIQNEIPHKLTFIDITDDPEVYKAYTNKTPVIETGPYHLFYPYKAEEIYILLKTAQDRLNRLIENDPKYPEKLESARTITKADRFSYWLTNHYMFVLNTILIIFVGLPFLAPVFEKYGAEFPARVIYKIYSPLCHQLAYRSWFLFGEQAAYPREIAELRNELSFEQATGLDSHDVLAAKAFDGNSIVGYKVAFCERDVAIYTGILVFGLLFSVTGKKLKSLPWYIWIIVGIIPIGIDGVSQLPSLINTGIAWLPIRESTPLLRTLTGALFGITTAWYGFPLIEETMLDSRKALKKKFALEGNKY
jgi:uncharacterized membrane protein